MREWILSQLYGHGLTPGGNEVTMAAPHNIDECKDIFVSWVWMIGIIVTIAAGACGLIYAYSQMESEQYIQIKDHEKRLIRCESVERDIDTIKNILRSK